jgi:hypothetical protein
MGSKIVWSYMVLWNPGADKPKIALYRRGSNGAVFKWAEVNGPGYEGMPLTDEVLQVLYQGLLDLIEETA